MEVLTYVVSRVRAGRRGCRGFTLLELMTVVALMAILLAMATLVFIEMGRGAAMRGSVQGIKTALVQARQFAITRRVRTTLKYGNLENTSTAGRRGYFVVATNETKAGCDVMNTNYLALGVVFFDQTGQALPNGLPRTLTFKLDGSTTTGIQIEEIRLVEEARSASSAGGLTNVLQVYPLTGRTSVKE